MSGYAFPLCWSTHAEYQKRCTLSSSRWIGGEPSLEAKHNSLVKTLQSYGRVAVAYSGGIDSTVVARAAYEALGDAAIAVTAVSDSLASGELEDAQNLAQIIGIRHRVIQTQEFADPNYLRNQPDRCYFCKSELYTRLSGLLAELGVNVIASGANTDDQGDYRPGMLAASENKVRIRSRSAGSARQTCVPLQKPGSCQPGTSRQAPAYPAALPMAKK